MTPRTVKEQLEEARGELRTELAAMEAELADNGTLTFSERKKLTSYISFAKDTLGSSPLKRQLEEARAEAKENLRTLDAVEFSSASDAEKLKAKKMAAFVRSCL